MKSKWLSHYYIVYSWGTNSLTPSSLNIDVSTELIYIMYISHQQRKTEVMNLRIYNANIYAHSITEQNNNIYECGDCFYVASQVLINIFST